MRIFFFVIIGMMFCNTKNIHANEVLRKQQGLRDFLFYVFNSGRFDSNRFVKNENVKIVTPDEELLLAVTISFDDFKHSTTVLIDIHTRNFGSGFVAAIRDGNVLFNKINPESHPAWYGRLHGYIMAHYNDSTIVPRIDLIDPDKPPINCICTLDMNVAVSFIISSFLAGKDIYAECLPKGLYLCNGDSKK